MRSLMIALFFRILVAGLVSNCHWTSHVNQCFYENFHCKYDGIRLKQWQMCTLVLSLKCSCRRSGHSWGFYWLWDRNTTWGRREEWNVTLTSGVKELLIGAVDWLLCDVLQTPVSGAVLSWCPCGSEKNTSCENLCFYTGSMTDGVMPLISELKDKRAFFFSLFFYFFFCFWLIA